MPTAITKIMTDENNNKVPLDKKFDYEEEDNDLVELDPSKLNYSYKFSEIRWPMMIKLTLLHLIAVYGAYLTVMEHTKWQTNVFALCIGVISGLGTMAGAHRLWSHRCYKATWPLK